MTAGSKGFITKDGHYYECEHQICPKDMEVPKRPSPNMYFRDGEWHIDRRNKTRIDNMPPSNNDHYEDDFELPPNVNLRRSNSQPRGNPHPSSFNHIHSHQPMSPNNQPQEMVISKNTLFKFDVKDLAIVIGFVFTTTMSWFTIDNRMATLERHMIEDTKKTEEIVKKNEELTKKLDDVNRYTAVQISELEKMLLNKK